MACGPSFDPYSDEFLENPHDVFRGIREACPVYYNEELDFYALTRYADVAEAYRDHAVTPRRAESTSPWCNPNRRRRR